MKKDFLGKFNLLTNILILTLLIGGGLIYADTNGLWTRAEDVVGGTFGGDETGNFSFNTSVNFTSEANFINVSANQYCDDNGENCFDYNDLVSGAGGPSELECITGGYYDAGTTNIQSSSLGFTYNFADVFLNNKNSQGRLQLTCINDWTLTGCSISASGSDNDEWFVNSNTCRGDEDGSGYLTARCCRSISGTGTSFSETSNIASGTDITGGAVSNLATIDLSLPPHNFDPSGPDPHILVSANDNSNIPVAGSFDHLTGGKCTYTKLSKLVFQTECWYTTDNDNILPQYQVSFDWIAIQTLPPAGIDQEIGEIDVYQCPVGKTPGWGPGGPWGYYGCQGQITTESTCYNIEYPHYDYRACTLLGKMKYY